MNLEHMTLEQFLDLAADAKKLKAALTDLKSASTQGKAEDDRLRKAAAEVLERAKADAASALQKAKDKIAAETAKITKEVERIDQSRQELEYEWTKLKAAQRDHAKDAADLAEKQAQWTADREALDAEWSDLRKKRDAFTAAKAALDGMPA